MKKASSFLFLALFTIFLSLTVDAQVDATDSTAIIDSTVKKCNSIFVEIGGNGLYYSVNYDRLFKVSEYFYISRRAGVHYSNNLLGNNYRFIGVPIEISGLASISDRHFLEIGAGITILNRRNNGDNHNETLAILALTAGFRYQRPNGGFFFKGGFTPLYNFYVDHPSPNTAYYTWMVLPGIAFGYTF